MRNESRFRTVERNNPEQFKQFLKLATEEAQKRHAVYQQLSEVTIPQPQATDADIEPKKVEK